jgi:hypothetical protein
LNNLVEEWNNGIGGVLARIIDVDLEVVVVVVVAVVAVAVVVGGTAVVEVVHIAYCIVAVIVERIGRGDYIGVEVVESIVLQMHIFGAVAGFVAGFVAGGIVGEQKPAVVLMVAVDEIDLAIAAG